MTSLCRLLTLLLVLIPVQGRADYLVASRAAVVRAEPGSKSTRLAKVEPGTVLRLRSGPIQNGYYPVLAPGTGEAGWVYKTLVRRYAEDEPPTPPVEGGPREVNCAAKLPMRVHFYDVGQALAALVQLPDGRKVLVDAGESPTRCGAVCKAKHEHLLSRLESDLNGAPISMLWITHQHSDHLGGVPAVLNKFRVELYVDNGQSTGKSVVKQARDAAAAVGARIVVVDPSSTRSPLPGSGSSLQLRSVVPGEWPANCRAHPNLCSIGLRIEYCDSSVLFTGDAEAREEALLETYGEVDLLQVGHHGSLTSSSDAFLAMVSPSYAVISAAKRGEGMNRTYCHPRRVTVEALTAVTGGAGTNTVAAFDGSSCTSGGDSDWPNVPTSDRLWVTSRDGDVVLETTGDGVFTRGTAN